jgi:UDP:flavonoid glycosyltransferase YjiC (YdhE family)
LPNFHVTSIDIEIYSRHMQRHEVKAKVDTMSRILIATWDGAGNFPPIKALASAILARGHEVFVLSHDTHRYEVAAIGAHFERYPTALQFDAAAEDGETTLIPELLASPKVAADLAAAIRRLQPDALLVDVLMLTGMQTAQASGRPYGVMLHSLYSLIQDPPYDIIRPPVDAADLALIFSYEAFDPPARPGRNAIFTGPLRPAAMGAPVARRFPGRPLVTVSLSTSEQRQQALLERLCRVLSALPVEAVVTTGRAIDPADLPGAANLIIVRSTPHEPLIAASDLVITHAGHGTVMAACTAGAPMLTLPMGRDQHHVAARVGELGLGVVLDQHAPDETIASAVRDLLADEAVRETCRAFACDVAGRTDAAMAAAAVENRLLVRVPA